VALETAFGRLLEAAMRFFCGEESKLANVADVAGS